MGASEGFNRASCSAEYGGSHVGIPGTEPGADVAVEAAGPFTELCVARPEHPSAPRVVKESARRIDELRARIPSFG
jgi:hypothetical protein